MIHVFFSLFLLFRTIFKNSPLRSHASASAATETQQSSEERSVTPTHTPREYDLNHSHSLTKGAFRGNCGKEMKLNLNIASF